jgi:hypothetical protein
MRGMRLVVATFTRYLFRDRGRPGGDPFVVATPSVAATFSRYPFPQRSRPDRDPFVVATFSLMVR